MAGCGKESVDPSPVGVTKRFVAAVSLRDTKAIWSLLGPKTRAHLEAAGLRATALVGGSPKVAPRDLLSPAWRAEAEPDWRPRTYRLMGVEGDRARVEVSGSQKHQREVVTLVREEGKWKVELDLSGRAEPAPRAAPGAKPEPSRGAAPEGEPELAPRAAPQPQPQPRPRPQPGARP